MIGIYILLLIVAVHNTLKFVFRDERGKNFHIVYFYALVYLISVARVTWLSLILYVVINKYDFLSNGPQSTLIDNKMK